MRKGFTLIELMIVIAIIAIIAAIAIPNLLESRVTANESAASSSLKSGVFSAQVSFQGGGYLDRDQDNLGEYGTLRMLAGIEASSRTPVGQLRLLTGVFANTQAWSVAGAASTSPGFVVANGFQFAAMTPSDTDSETEDTEALYYDGVGVTLTTSLQSSIAATDANANQGERAWAAGCIPQEWGNTGRRIFTIGADGQIRSPAAPAIQNEVYSGATTPLANGAKPGTNGAATAVGVALGRALASSVSTQVATAVSTISLTMFDGTTYNGFPIFNK